MPRKMDPNNTSFRDSVVVLLQQPIQALDTMMGPASTYQALSLIAEEFHAVGASSQDDYRIENLKFKLQAANEAALKTVGWAKAPQDKDLEAIVGPANQYTQQVVEGIPKLLKDARELMPLLKVDCAPGNEEYVAERRAKLTAAIGEIEQHFKDTVDKTFENKRAEQGHVGGAYL